MPDFLAPDRRRLLKVPDEQVKSHDIQLPEGYGWDVEGDRIFLYFTGKGKREPVEAYRFTGKPIEEFFETLRLDARNHARRHGATF